MNKAQQSVAHIYFLDPSGRPRVGWDNWHDAKVGDKLYAAPPQREWIGLTDSEVDNIVAYPWGETKNWIKAIEDAVKKKNT